MNQWEKEVAQSLLNDEKAVLEELTNQYEKALQDIQREIVMFESDIARLDLALSDSGLSDEQKAILLSRKQAKVYQKQYQEALEGQLNNIMYNLCFEGYETINQYLTESYDNAFIGELYNLQQQGVPIIVPIDQKAAVRAILTNSKLNAGLYAKLGIDLQQMKTDITREVTRGIAKGMLYKDMARNLKNVSGVSLGKAKTIVRTEAHRIQEASRNDAQHRAKDIGADVVKQWDSALDSRTRESHVQLDGEIREIDEKFSNGLMYPGDSSGKAAEVINCRCRSNTRAKWALSASETKHLGNVADMSDKQKEAIAKKLHVPVEELDKYSEQIVPIDAKNYEDFKRQYKEYWHYEGSDLQKEAEARIASYKTKGKAGKVAVQEAEPAIVNHFKPAQTVQEAEDYAKKNGVKYADYSKLPLDMANELNKALDTLPDGVKPVFVGDSTALERYWGGKLPRSSKNYYGVTIDTFNGIHLGRNETTGMGVIDFETSGYMVGISSNYKTADKITAAKLVSQAKYQQKYGRKWYFNENGNTTPYHEMGHVYANTKGLPDGFEAAAAKWAEEAQCDMLKKTSEAWAEAWAAYHTDNKDLPDYIRTYIKAASSAKSSGKVAKNSLISFDDDAIIKSKIEVFAKDLREGKVQTKISQQKQARHIFGTKEYTASAEKKAKTGDKPSYLREDLTIEDISEIVKNKLGTGIIEVKGDDSFQEFFDCDEIIGYCFSKSDGEYKPTKRVQVKYALGDGNIHIIPVRGKS